MVVRLKSRWHRSKRSDRNKKGSREPKTLLDLASVIGINIWKLSREAFVKLEREGFRFRDDLQAISFVEEFLIFQLHITDRMLFGKVDDSERASFINAVAIHLGTSLSENQSELLGENHYKEALIERMNERSKDYAECEFNEEGPSYPLIRTFAHHVADCLKATDDKWMVEQIMDIDAPEIIQRIMPIIEQILGLQTKAVVKPS